MKNVEEKKKILPNIQIRLKTDGTWRTEQADTFSFNIKKHTIKLRSSKNIFKIIRVKDDPFGIDINIINLILHPRFFLANLGMAKAD